MLFEYSGLVEVFRVCMDRISVVFDVCVGVSFRGDCLGIFVGFVLILGLFRWFSFSCLVCFRNWKF